MKSRIVMAVAALAVMAVTSMPAAQAATVLPAGLQVTTTNTGPEFASVTFVVDTGQSFPQMYSSGDIFAAFMKIAKEESVIHVSQSSAVSVKDQGAGTIAAASVIECSYITNPNPAAPYGAPIVLGGDMGLKVKTG